MIKTTLTVLTFLVFSSLTYAQNYIGEKTDIDKILRNIKSFSEHVMASDHAKIGASYTSDAKIFPSNRDIIRGEEAITRYWIQPSGTSVKFHKITPEEIKINGNEAYDYGYYEGISVNSEGQENSWKGKYVIIWRKVDDDWKIYLDIWNRIQN